MNKYRPDVIFMGKCEVAGRQLSFLVVSGSGLVGGGRLVGRGGLVGRSRLVGRGGLVGRSRLVGRGGLVAGLVAAGLVRGVLSLTLVGDVGNQARVGVVHTVGDRLGTAVGQHNRVRSLGGVAVTGLLGVELGLVVSVSVDVVAEVVLGRLVIALLVSRGLVGRPRVVGRLGLVGRGRGGVGRAVGGGNGQQGGNHEELKKEIK